MKISIALIFLLGSFSSCYAGGFYPGNVEVKLQGLSVTLTWQLNESVFRYRARLNNRQEQETATNQATFSGLTPDTIYDALVEPIDENGFIYDLNDIAHVVFRTSRNLDVDPEEKDVYGMYYIPRNLSAKVASTAVGLFWEPPKKDVFQYRVSLSDGQSELTQNPFIAFGRLTSSTSYSANVIAVYENGTSYAVDQTAEIDFVTLAILVRGLRVTNATETTINVAWDETQDARAYDVLVQDDHGRYTSSDVDIAVNGTSASISGLQRITFYTIMVQALTSKGQGDFARLRTRTAGSGLAVTALWKRFNGIHGGEATIFRPLVVPDRSRPYSIRVVFPCALERCDVWNAKLNKEFSNLGNGVVIITQKELWEPEKTSIGLTFYLQDSISGSSCRIDTTNITVEFDVELRPPPDKESIETDVLVRTTEWDNISGNAMIGNAGVIHINLTVAFGIPQRQIDSDNPKPPPGRFVIAVDSGKNCQIGIFVEYAWGMAYKFTENIAEADPRLLYFVQEGSDYFSNEPGFIYGYDPVGCASRDGISAKVIAGGSLVNKIVNASTVPPNYNK